VDEFNRECLAIDVAKKLTSEDMLGGSSDLFVCNGAPDHIRSDSRERSRPSASVNGWGELGRKLCSSSHCSPFTNRKNVTIESFFCIASRRVALAGSFWHAA